MAKWRAESVDRRWLVELFENAGLAREQASRAADLAYGRLARWHPAKDDVATRAAGFGTRPRSDPASTVERLLGRTSDALPFVDDGRVSVVAVGNLLCDAGCDSVVALAFAKVIVEAYEPADIYRPIWKALGRTGPVELDALARMDWSAAGFDEETERAPLEKKKR